MRSKEEKQRRNKGEKKTQTLRKCLLSETASPFTQKEAPLPRKPIIVAGEGRRGEQCGEKNDCKALCKNTALYKVPIIINHLAGGMKTLK